MCAEPTVCYVASLLWRLTKCSLPAGTFKRCIFFSGSCLNKDILKLTWCCVHCLTKLTYVVRVKCCELKLQISCRVNDFVFPRQQSAVTCSTLRGAAAAGTRCTRQPASEDKPCRSEMINIIDSDYHIQMSSASCSSSDKLTRLQDQTVSWSRTQIKLQLCLGWFWAQCDLYLSRTLSSGAEGEKFFDSGGFGLAALLRLMLMSGGREKASAGRRVERVNGTDPTGWTACNPPAPRETRAI